ncbi:MAG: phage portal protein [Verrucomicrobium sp.]|nr:phage portal protein [Verrucomicrobium sp.]
MKNLRTLLGRLLPQATVRASFPWNTFASSLATTEPRLCDPYRNSAFVQAAIRTIAQPISAVPLRFYQARGRRETLLSHGPLVDFWARPAGDHMDFQDFIEATVGWLLLQGEAFWVGDDTWLLQTATERRPLFLARPDRMRPILDNGQLQGWEWTDANGTAHALVPDQVAHLKFWNPYDPVRGLAPYLSAALAAEADWLGSRFVRTLMQNNGDLGQFLIAKGAPPTDEQREQIIRALREKKELSQRGVYKPMFLTGDIAVENPQVQAADASLVATRQLLRDEIAIAFGIPPSRFHVKQSYSIGSASDRFLLIEETCMPLSIKIAGAVERLSERVAAWRPAGGRIHAAFDWNEHSTMQAARRERFAVLDKLWNKGVPLRTCSEVLDLGLPAVPGDHVGYLPAGLSPVDAPAEAPEEEADPSPAWARIESALRRRNPNPRA